MIEFEGYYSVSVEQVAYVSMRNGTGKTPYGLFLNLEDGKELGVWYQTEISRKQAKERIVREIESEKRQDAERILNRLAPGGFAHERQSLRVVEELENDGVGLNLTEAVRDGILQHTSRGNPATLEGAAVSLSDRIAYINHDIDDATRAGALREEELPRELTAVLGHTHGDRIDTMIGDIFRASDGQPFVRMSEEIYTATMALRAFLFAHVYNRPDVQREEQKAAFLLESLFDYYAARPEQMPEEFVRQARSDPRGVKGAVCDYIAGMTDNYAVHTFTRLFIPKNESL
mgnify:CR=1 FL=1